jgi:3-dehydroquinate synthase
MERGEERAKVLLDAWKRGTFNGGMVATLTVKLGERSYPIRFGTDLSGEVRQAVDGWRAAGRKVAVLTDANLVRAQAGALRAMFGEAPVLAVEAGEGAKSLAGLGRVLDFLAERKLDRGGVLVRGRRRRDRRLGGFAAAAWLRGIDFVQVPTTLLAMVDSSVGGKTGINMAAGKNLAGRFTSRGRCTSRRAAGDAAGAGICRGHGRGDQIRVARRRGVAGAGWSASRSRCQPDLAAVIRRCCAIKAGIVEADERETAKEGGRALLNLGHTFGHAIENVAGYGEYLHGEAVAIGLGAAARLSQKLGYIDAADVARIERVVAAHGLPVRLRAPLPYAALYAAMTRDKKVRAGGLRFVVLRRWARRRRRATCAGAGGGEFPRSGRGVIWGAFRFSTGRIRIRNQRHVSHRRRNCSGVF